MRLPKLLLIPLVAMLQGATMVDGPLTKDSATKAMDKYVRSEVPGLQYIVVAADDTLFEYAGGLADIQNQKTMTLDTTLMAYSMTKGVGNY